MDDLPPVPPAFEVPDFIEAALGWRLWRVDPEEVRLKGLVKNAVWEPRTRFTASCDRLHAAPAEDCSCGIYALNSLRPYSFRDLAFHRPRERLLVVGTASLWGVMFEGSRGFRSEHAKPKELWVVPIPWFAVDGGAVTKVAANIATAYDVPCEVGDWPRFFGSA